MDEDTIFSPAYPVEFLSRDPLALDPQGLRQALSRRFGAVDGAADADPDKALLFYLRDFPVRLEDATVCAQLAFLQTDNPVEPADYQEAVQQSWDTEDAGGRLNGCHRSLALVNLMSSPLPQAVRRRIVAGGLLATMEHAGVELISWPQTQQLLDPQKAVKIWNAPEQRENPVYGFVNVRFYNTEGTDGEKVMDTLGLGALGLTDLQMHYRDLEPGDVAGFLHNLAAYLLEHGDVIDNGHTVQGFAADDRWLCMHEMALVAPQRVVLDINPGPNFAAGRN